MPTTTAVSNAMISHPCQVRGPQPKPVRFRPNQGSCSGTASPLKLRYLVCGANSTDAVGAESLPCPRSTLISARASQMPLPRDFGTSANWRRMCVREPARRADRHPHLAGPDCGQGKWTGWPRRVAAKIRHRGCAMGRIATVCGAAGVLVAPGRMHGRGRRRRAFSSDAGFDAR